MLSIWQRNWKAKDGGCYAPDVNAVIEAVFRAGEVIG